MCMRKSKATKPARMPAPLARETSRRRRDPGVGRLMALSLPRCSRARSQNLPELGRLPLPAVTGLRSILARRALRQLMRGGLPGCAARRARSMADGSRYLAAPTAPDVTSRSCRSKSSGPGTASGFSIDI